MVQNSTILSSHKTNIQYINIYLEKLPQRTGFLNRSPIMKIFWKGLRNTFGQYAWSWSLLIFGISFAWFHSIYHPYLAVYRYNNENVIKQNYLENLC